MLWGETLPGLRILYGMCLLEKKVPGVAIA